MDKLNSIARIVVKHLEEWNIDDNITLGQLQDLEVDLVNHVRQFIESANELDITLKP